MYQIDSKLKLKYYHEERISMIMNTQIHIDQIQYELKNSSLIKKLKITEEKVNNCKIIFNPNLIKFRKGENKRHLFYSYFSYEIDLPTEGYDFDYVNNPTKSEAKIILLTFAHSLLNQYHDIIFA